MSKFKPYKELTILKPVTEGGLFKIVDSSGWVYAEVANEENVYRFIDCWNACRKIAFPEAHISESDAYVARLESLRKEAWARAERLQVEFDLIRANSGLSI